MSHTLGSEINDLKELALIHFRLMKKVTFYFIDNYSLHPTIIVILKMSNSWSKRVDI